MGLSNPTSQRGATVFQNIVVVILLLIFVTIAADRIWTLRIAAERTGMAYRLGTLRSLLGTELAATVVKEGVTALGRYHHSNPMRLFEAPPANYLGEFDTAPEPPPVGAWYFDRSTSVLVYRVHFSDYFRSDNPLDPAAARFQIQLDFRDNNHNGRYDPAIDSPRSLRLVSLDNYHWIGVDEQE